MFVYSFGSGVMVIVSLVNKTMQCKEKSERKYVRIYIEIEENKRENFSEVSNIHLI